MTQSNHAVYGTFDEEIRWYKGPPSMAITEHWNYTDTGKDFPGGYSFMSQGPLAIDWAHTVTSGRGLWGMELRNEMAKYIHQAGLKIVGEVLPQEKNRVELADETDELGLRIPRVVFSYAEEDKKLYEHALRFMSDALSAAGGKDIWTEDDTCHLLGTCRMGSDPKDSVTDADGRCWDIPNLWICDGSLFPTCGGVNPSLTIQALACRIGDRIGELGRRGEL
jgi:choline dehydrogenase-like flavoprotein